MLHSVDRPIYRKICSVCILEKKKENRKQAIQKKKICDISVQFF